MGIPELLFMNTIIYVLFWVLVLVFCLLGLHLEHMEVPGIGVKSELKLLAFAIATAMQDPNHVCDLHHSLWKRRILNPLSKDRDRTRNLMVTSRIH